MVGECKKSQIGLVKSHRERENNMRRVGKYLVCKIHYVCTNEECTMGELRIVHGYILVAP